LETVRTSVAGDFAGPAVQPNLRQEVALLRRPETEGARGHRWTAYARPVRAELTPAAATRPGWPIWHAGRGRWIPPLACGPRCPEGLLPGPRQRGARVRGGQPHRRGRLQRAVAAPGQAAGTAPLKSPPGRLACRAGQVLARPTGASGDRL